MTWEEISKELFEKRTAKRFTLRVHPKDNGVKIFDDGADENEQLKQQDKINEDCYKKLLQKYDDLKKENKELKEKNKFILGQIKAFRDDCYTAIDFDGVSTLNRLLDILREER